eukprot:COSAG02_NODE_24438_length_688_cov_0.882852_1_plen_78_part_10
MTTSEVPPEVASIEQSGIGGSGCEANNPKRVRRPARRALESSDSDLETEEMAAAMAQPSKNAAVVVDLTDVSRSDCDS